MPPAETANPGDPHALGHTLTAGGFVRRGKVRDLFEVGDRLLLVASDRLSAFDVVLPTPIPDKGRLLTGLSRFRFAETTGNVPNHLRSPSTKAEQGTHDENITFDEMIDRLVPISDDLEMAGLLAERVRSIALALHGYDKQFVRDWLESQPWDKTAPGPELPAEIVAGTRERYVEAYERITGASFARYLEEDVIAR